jgi:hypothetical protein
MVLANLIHTVFNDVMGGMWFIIYVYGYTSRLMCLPACLHKRRLLDDIDERSVLTQTTHQKSAVVYGYIS